MKTILCLALCTVLTAVGCVSATINESSACDSDTISFPIPALSSLKSELPSTVPAYLSDFDAGGVDAGAYLSQVPDAGSLAYNLPPFSQSTSFDFSSAVNDITDVTSNVQVMINSLTLDNSSGVFDWLTYVSVVMTAEGLPALNLATYAPTTLPGAQINLLASLSPQATAATLLNYFESGPVTLTITIGSSSSGTTINEGTLKFLQGLNGQLTTTVASCISASASLSKSL